MSARRWWLTTAALGLAGCIDEPPALREPQTIEGRHIVVRYEPTMPVCARSVAAADEFIEAAAALFELEPPEVEYSVYDSYGVTGCGGGLTLGCTDGGSRVFSSYWIYHHELAHAVAAPMGQPPGILLEGLAEALGNPYPQLTAEERRAEPIVDILDPAAFYGGPAVEVNHRYRVAGDFNGYLLGRFGAATYAELYSSLLALSDALTIRRAFAEATGASLEAVIADWRAHDPVPGEAPDLVGARRCDGEAVAATSPGRFEVDADIDCLTKWINGPGALHQPVRYTVELEAGLHAIGFRGTPDDQSVTGSLERCGDAAALPLYGAARPTYLITELAAGRHRMEVLYSDVAAEPAPVAHVGWSIDRLGRESADCAGAPAWAAPAGGWLLQYARPADAWPGRITDPELGEVAVSWLRLDAPAEPGTWWFGWALAAGARSGARVSICAGGCQALACWELPRDADRTSMIPAPGAPVWVELRTLASTPSSPIYIEAEAP